MTDERERGSDRQMAQSQIAELHNARVLLEEARNQIENLSEHRRARLDASIRTASREVDAQLRDLAREL